MTRPILLLLIIVLLHAAAPAQAKDGDSGGSNSSGSNSSGSNSGSGGSDHDVDDDHDDDHDDDSERARDGVSSGAILPLETILRLMDARFAGRLIDVDLKRRGGRDIYELQIINDRGHVLEVDVDAATARVVKYEVD